MEEEHHHHGDPIAKGAVLEIHNSDDQIHHTDVISEIESDLSINQNSPVYDGRDPIRKNVEVSEMLNPNLPFHVDRDDHTTEKQEVAGLNPNLPVHVDRDDHTAEKQEVSGAKSVHGGVLHVDNPKVLNRDNDIPEDTNAENQEVAGLKTVDGGVQVADQQVLNSDDDIPAGGGGGGGNEENEDYDGDNEDNNGDENPEDVNGGYINIRIVNHDDGLVRDIILWADRDATVGMLKYGVIQYHTGFLIENQEMISIDNRVMENHMPIGEYARNVEDFIRLRVNPQDPRAVHLRYLSANGLHNLPIRIPRFHDP